MVATSQLTVAQALIIGVIVWGVPLGALHLACAAIFGSLADRRSPPAAS